MPRGGKKYRRRKKAVRRKYSPKQVQYRGNAKYQLANKVELIRPITLKPKSVIKKFIFYNIAEVQNSLISGLQNAQFATFYLNSPWMLAADTYTDQGSNTWKWNRDMTQHTSGSSAATGTSYPGFFGPTGTGIGYGYQDACIVGSKFTVTAQPMFKPNEPSGDPCALFAVVDSQGSALSQTSKIEDLYDSPYSQVRRIANGGSNDGSLNGNVKDASIVLKYSPKRFNNIKDIRDNHGFFSHISADATTANHPGELDRVSFGIVNLLSNPTTKRGMGNVILQVKQEITCLFSEPFNNSNQYPAMPALQPIILG